MTDGSKQEELGNITCSKHTQFLNSANDLIKQFEKA